MKCTLCLEGVGGKEHRLAGITVCDACVKAPYLPARLKRREFHLSYSYRADDSVLEIGAENPADGRTHELAVLAEVPHPSGMHVRLQAEDIGTRLSKLLHAEIQIGNPEFDDLVFIRRTSTPEEARAFLSLSGVQAAVVDLIHAGATVDFDLAKVYVRAEKKGPLNGRAVLLCSAALAHYLDEFAK